MLKSPQNVVDKLPEGVKFHNYYQEKLLSIMSDDAQQTLIPEIREILSQHGRVTIDQLSEADDLYNAGLTSLATVAVMLALEDKFNIEFPENMLGRRTFKSIESIAEAVTQLAA